MSSPTATPGSPQNPIGHPKTDGAVPAGAGTPPPPPPSASPQPMVPVSKVPGPPPANRSGQTIHGGTGITRRPGSTITAAVTGGPKAPTGATTGAGQRPPTGVSKPPVTGAQQAPMSGARPAPVPAGQPAPVAGARPAPVPGARPAPVPGARPANTTTGRQPAPGQGRPPATGQGRPPATGQARPPASGQARPPATGQGRPPAAGQARKPGVAGRPGRQSNRRAHLRVTKLDLLSILKMSFLFAFCVGIVIFVALFLLWSVLVNSGAIASAQSLLNSVMANPNSAGPIDLSQFLSSQRIVGFITAVSVLNIFLLTLLGTVFGMLYNLAASMFGGLEVTLEV